MTDKLPKDLAAAKRGYEAFYDEQPNIWFEDLSHTYQMRWVRAARAITEEHRNYKGPGRPNGKVEMPSQRGQFWKDLENMEPKTFLDKYVPKYGKRYGWAKMKDIEQRRAAKLLWDRAIKKQSRKSADG